MNKGGRYYMSDGERLTEKEYAERKSKASKPDESKPKSGAESKSNTAKRGGNA